MTDKINFTIWGKTIEFDTIQYAVKQLCDGVELRIKENTNKIISNRINGVPFKISHMQGKDAWDIVPYMWDNTEYIESVIADTKNFVNGILADYGITINPNWQEINSEWLAQLKKIEDIFSDALNTCTKAAMQNQVVRYNQAYNEELSKDFGLSFGILSNSLTAHLVYAAQETAKERKDHERASKAAAEAMNDAGAKITVQVYENVHPLYVDSVEPALLKLLGEYYSYIVSIFAKELGTTPDEIKLDFDEEKSNNILCESSTNPQESITDSLSINPDNGNVIGYAIMNGVLDETLCQYGKDSSPKFLIAVKKWSECKLAEIFNSGKLFNKPIINDDNRHIIDGLICFFSYVSGNIRNSKEWQNIVVTVYGKEIVGVAQEFSQISSLILSPLDFKKAAKEQTAINISDSNRHLFVLFYNELFVDTIINTAEIMELECPVTIDALNKAIRAFNDKMTEAHDEFVKKAEQQRLEQEENERIRNEKQREEHEKKVRTTKKATLICSIVLVALLICYFSVTFYFIPDSNYKKALTLVGSQNYEEAITEFEKLNGFKESEKKIEDCKNSISERDYQKAITLYDSANYTEAYDIFTNLHDYSESGAYLIKSAEAIGDEKFNKKAYETSIEWYEKANNLDKVKLAKYQYVQCNLNCSNETTYKYLNELKANSYKDSASVYANLYTLKFEYVINDSPTDTTTDMYSFKYQSGADLGGYIYIHFRYTGGTPGQNIWVCFDGWQSDLAQVKCNGNWNTFIEGRCLIYGQTSSKTDIKICVGMSAYDNADILGERTVTVYS